ncbi:MAG: metallophosphoesterase family protein [Nitrospiraceae bacterium]
MSRARMIRIGVIADTHGLFDPSIEKHFSGVTEILHAGDIGGRSVIRQLQQIAPVVAVSGNIDGYEKSGLPRQLLIRRAGITIGLCHVLYESKKLTTAAQSWLDQEQPDVCVFGHSHRPMIGRHGHIVLFNPGSAGPRRFSLPRGVGVLTITQGKVWPRLISLGDPAGHRNVGTGTVRNRSKIKGAL